MKKFIVLLGILCSLLGLRFADNGLLGAGIDGTYTVYRKDGSECVYSAGNLPLLDRFDAYATRLDVDGGEAEAVRLLKNLNAHIKWRERPEDGPDVVYAYSPDILRYKEVHGARVNLMLAISGTRVSAGCPLLLGSY